VPGGVYAIAVTPGGRAAYVSSQSGQTTQKPNGDCTGPPGDVTPISTARNTPGKPIRIGCNPYFLAIAPDGKTVWVLSAGDTVTAIATATNSAGKPITVPSAVAAIVIAP
jgi:DNA-binding beta-propeller fold protein YncE